MAAKQLKNQLWLILTKVPGLMTFGNHVKARWKRIPKSQQRFLLFGLPMITVIVGSSFALREFQDIKMDRRDRFARKLSPEETQNFKKNREKTITIEEAYEEIQQDIDIDNWENKRGPRPWENNEEEGKNG